MKVKRITDIVISILMICLGVGAITNGIIVLVLSVPATILVIENVGQTFIIGLIGCIFFATAGTVIILLATKKLCYLRGERLDATSVNVCDPTEKLEHLFDLSNKGVLTEEEFDQQKKVLLKIMTK